jgi:hypothetical protein
MKGIHFSFLILFAVSIQLARSAEAPALIERPQAEAGPTRVSVGIWMVDITNIDSAQQNFTAEVAVVLRWRDPRLTHRKRNCALLARTGSASAGCACE